MSSIPGGGAVVIPFVPDMTAVFAALGNLRANTPTIGIPIAPQGAVAPQGAIPPPAATFANLGGGSVFTPSATLAGLSPGGGWASPWTAGGGIRNLSTGGFGVGPAAGAVGGAGGTQATTALTQAAAALESAALSLKASAGGGGLGGGGGIEDAGGGDDGGGGSKGKGKGRGGNSRGVFAAGRLARYATIGFALREVVSLGEQYEDSNLQTSLETRNLIPGSGSASLIAAKNYSGWKESVRGLAGGSLTPWGYKDKQDDAAAISDAEEREKDAQSRFSSEISNIGTRADTQGIIRNTESYRQTGFARDISRIQNRYLSEQDAANAHVDQEKLKIAASDSIPERNRLQQQLHDWKSAQGDKLNAQFSEASTQTDDLKRELDLQADALIRRAPEGAAAAEGRFGISREREFARSLADAQAAADEKDPLLGQYTRQLNNYATAGRREEIRLGIDTRNADTERNRLLINNDPLAASIRTITARRDSALHYAKNNADSDSINSNAQSEIDLTNHDFSQSLQRERVGIRSDTARFNILSDRSTDPSSRAATARTFSIVNSAQQEALADFENGRGSLVPDVFKRGQAELQAARQSRIDQFDAVQFDPTRQATTGSGTEDVGKVLQTYEDAIKQLATIPSKIDELLKIIGDLAG